LQPEETLASQPELSALVVFGEERARASRCLRHLLSQSVIESMEIVVVDLSAAGGGVEGLDHPAVRWFHRPDIDEFGTARAECIRQSRSGILAFLEDHCYADPRWAEEVLRAFQQQADIVNYAMMEDNPGQRLCKMFLMVEYGRWMDPAISGYVSISACNNVAYRRSALKPWWERLDSFCGAEFVLHREMQTGGARVWLAAGAKLSHENWTRLSDGLAANCAMKRVLAAARSRHGRWSSMKRLAWASAMTITPPIHVARLVRSLVRRPSLWPVFWISLPLAVLVYTRSAWSEAMGYLFGEGGAAERFRDMEISIARRA